MFDPFECVDIEERPVIEEEMFTVPIGEKVVGIDEGLLMGLAIGFIITSIFG